MKLSILSFLLIFVSCSPKINNSLPTSDIPTNKVPIKSEREYYFFENDDWAIGTPDHIPEAEQSNDLLMHIFKTMSYPVKARNSGTQGTVYITVIQNEVGHITSSEIKSGIGNGCEEEALRVIQLASKKKVKLPPIYKNGIPVKVKHDMPVRFKLE